jgi:hypothetical protein
MPENSPEQVREAAQGIDPRPGAGDNPDRAAGSGADIEREAPGKPVVPGTGVRVIGVIVCNLGAAVSLTVAQSGLISVEMLDRTGGTLAVVYGLFTVAIGLTVFVLSVVSAVAFAVVRRSESLGIRMKLLQGAGVGLLTLGLAIAAEFFAFFR